MCINKRYFNASGKTIQFPLRISDGFCWSPNERIELKFKHTIEYGNEKKPIKGFIVHNLDYVGAFECYETAWISEQLLNESFKEVQQ